ncbi:hypothetical protein CYMTET_18075 [Cymbomonas tetramitiformis]|uniref:Uncharacterized protein n=1 Tax=Cymbomonas tetramitiformis TaxID=36881 RepID=A0AAE0L6M9_9CHLO|nr:hypothetical protein CYMTET_18075 [Cymbomonas tetramitiformis]
MSRYRDPETEPEDPEEEYTEDFAPPIFTYPDDGQQVHADALVVPPPPAPPSAPQSVVSDEEMYPVNALHAHEPHMSFMDKFAVNLDLTGPEPTLAMHSMGTVAPADSVSVAADDSEDDGECLPPPRRTLGCGRPPMGFGFSALTSLAVCLLFVVCATAMPSRDRSAQDSSAAPEHTGDEVGGASVLTPPAVPPALYWRPEGWYPNDHGGYLGTLWTWYPGPSQPPVAAPIVTVPPSPGGAPPSPVYVPQAGGPGMNLLLQSSTGPDWLHPVQLTTTTSAHPQLSHFALRMICQTVVPALLGVVTGAPALPGTLDVARVDEIGLACLQIVMLLVQVVPRWA